MFYSICRKPVKGIGVNILNTSRLWLPKTSDVYSPLYVFGFNILTSRTTFILKRKYPLNRTKSDSARTRLKSRNYVYDLVEDTEVTPQGKIDVILKKYVKGIGQQGDVVSVSKSVAYNELLLPGHADYVTPETLQFWSNEKKDSVQEVKYSSPFVERTINNLNNKKGVSVVMNKETKWTIEPWHVRVSFRKAGVHMNEDCIEMPPYKIEGPNLDLEGKHFFVTVTINKKEKVKVKCIIHHWSTVIVDRLPYVESFWLLPQQSVFPEETETPDATK